MIFARENFARVQVQGRTPKKRKVFQELQTIEDCKTTFDTFVVEKPYLTEQGQTQKKTVCPQLLF